MENNTENKNNKRWTTRPIDDTFWCKRLHVILYWWSVWDVILSMPPESKYVHNVCLLNDNGIEKKEDRKQNKTNHLNTVRGYQYH